MPKSTTNGSIRRPQGPVSSGNARPGFALLAAAGLLAAATAACSAAGNPSADSTRSARTVAMMITELAMQQPSPTPTAYTMPETVPSATTGPSVTPTEIATVAFPTNTPLMSRATYNGSTPTTDATSLQTRTLTNLENAAFLVGVTGNSAVAAGSTFTLTMIIRNVGTNTWYPSYLIYWHSGARMDAPAYIFLPEVTAPNQTLFLAIDLKAPEDAKTYYQRWYFRDPHDTQFGIGPNGDEPLVFYIDVV